jgi:hypothetical protein
MILMLMFVLNAELNFNSVMDKIEEVFIGHIIIKSIFVGSKSDGYIAYLFTDKFKHYKLSREGMYDPSDDFFYKYNKKYVQATGYLFQDKKLTVIDISELEDPFEKAQNIDDVIAK